jgi:hypothetical protein
MINIYSKFEIHKTIHNGTVNMDVNLNYGLLN